MIIFAMTFTVTFLITYPIWSIFFDEAVLYRPKHVENPFGAVTRDSYGTMVLPDKKSWNESPEFYAAQCEVDDYLREKTK